MHFHEQLGPKSGRFDCAELRHAADLELRAFFTAVLHEFGAEQARASAEIWLREFVALEAPIASIRRACKIVTVAAAVSLSEQIAASDKQASGIAA